MTADLFSTQPSESLVVDYREAWAAWLQGERKAGRLQQASSIDVYAHMWTALTTWCVKEGLGVDAVSSDDLDRFLSSRGGVSEVTDRHAWRFLRLVERVLAYRHRTSASAAHNAATELLETRPAYRYANAADKDPLPSYLAAGEAKRLVTFLSAVRPGRHAAGRSWQEVRNRAAVALMLGAGVTPGEVRALEVPDVVTAGGRLQGVPWKLHVQSHPDSPARETPLAPWAGQLLAYWMTLRSEQSIPGIWLFPSTRTGKPWSKVSQYNATKEVLGAAGIDDVDGGSFRLRHTFALRQLKRGRAPDEVARWLGVTDPAVVARYQRVLLSPVEVV